jgi:hypothetical protein
VVITANPDADREMKSPPVGGTNGKQPLLLSGLLDAARAGGMQTFFESGGS